MADSTKLLQAIAALLWPIIFGLIVWRLFPAIKNIVSSRSFSVKIGGAEISVQNATEQIRTQIEDLQKQVILLRGGQAPPHLPEAQTSPAERATPHNRVLWVDDKPSNNAMEIAQLVNDGISVDMARSTEEGLARLESGALFAAVISDMGRTEDEEFEPEAGLTLLRAMRRKQLEQPFMVYSSKRSAQRYDHEVRASGGYGATASPIVLREWIGKVLGG